MKKARGIEAFLLKKALADGYDNQLPVSLPTGEVGLKNNLAQLKAEDSKSGRQGAEQGAESKKQK